jgi:YD repeat-containing protein
MKKFFLLSLALLLFASCSDEESTAGRLAKIKQTEYDEYGIQYKLITDYKAGKPVKVSYYDRNDIFVSYLHYEYTTEGLLASIGSYTKEHALVYKHSYTYDAQGRLITGLHESNESSWTTYSIAYTYNNDNTITGTRDGDMPLVTTFYLNTDGVIYKLANEAYTGEVTFDGTNPITLQDANETVTYEYDTIQHLSQLGLEPVGGAFKANAVLLNGLPGNNEFATRYIIKETHAVNNGTEPYSYRREYKFTTQGLPYRMTQRSFYGDIMSEFQYYYD